MSVQPSPRMTVDAFLAWAEGRDGRYELVDGEVVAMAPERARHARVKFAAAVGLQTAIRSARLNCEVFLDGVAVRIDAVTSYVPDVLVHCGDPIDPDAMEVSAPVIVVEVISPSLRSIDTNRKLEGYFRVPSVVHYLVVDSERPLVIHHTRADETVIETRIASTGLLRIEPPGLTIDMSDLFESVRS